MVLTHLLYFHQQISVHNPNYSSHVMMKEKKRGEGLEVSHVSTKEKEEKKKKREIEKVGDFGATVFPQVKKCLNKQERESHHVSQVSR
jgi:hypothetical protein